MDEDSSEEEVQVVQSKSKKDYSIDDIMQLDSKLSISKKKQAPVPMDNKSRGIKKERKKVQAKKSKKIVKF